MTDSIIPTPVRRAAKRAAVRTAAQTLGAALDIVARGIPEDYSESR